MARNAAETLEINKKRAKFKSYVRSMKERIALLTDETQKKELRDELVFAINKFSAQEKLELAQLQQKTDTSKIEANLLNTKAKKIDHTLMETDQE